MSLIGVGLNLLLAMLLIAALGLGWRLNRRLKALRDSHDGFAVAVRELNAAAARAEQGLADLRAATDEATDALADRIERGRALAAKLERLVDQGGRESRETGALEDQDRAQERRLGALLAAAREARAKPERLARPPLQPARARMTVEDDLFDEPLTLRTAVGGRR